MWGGQSQDRFFATFLASLVTLLFLDSVLGHDAVANHRTSLREGAPAVRISITAMDPISAAGIGLNVASLALQLFAGCIQGYQIFLDARDMPVIFEHLRVRLRVEQARLLNWGEKVGLMEELLEQTSVTLQLHRNLILDILLEIQQLFKSCLKIEQSFGNLVAPTDLADDTQTFDRRLEKSINTILRKTLKVLDKSTQLPKRLQWALVKQNGFETLIEKLISYNDSIVSLLDRATIDQLHEMQVQTRLIMLQLSSKVDDLRQLSLAMQISTHANSSLAHFPGNTPPASTEAADQRADSATFARLAAFKAQQTSIELTSLIEDPLPIDSGQISLVNTNFARSEAMYKGEHIWIEWKEYDNSHQVPGWSRMIEHRVKKLVSLLSLQDMPEEFKAPHCLGYFDNPDEDDSRYGLIYSKPKYALPSFSPRSLLDLIREGEKPSLTVRVSLAHAVAQSLMYLHSVNWLHKGFRSDSVVFFARANTEPDYTKPIISGFEYSRPDRSEELTEKPSENFEHDMYRHPGALGDSRSRSLKSHDIYSLGVVLAEIACWKTIEELVNINPTQKHARKRMRKVRQLLLEAEFLNRVGVEAGERFREVAWRCLKGGRELGIPDDADESTPDVGVEMQQVFFSKIVRKLKSIEV